MNMPHQTQSRSKRTLPENITIPGYEAYQVRIVRGEASFSTTFPWSNYRSTESALAAAVAWRDNLKAQLPAPGNGKNSSFNKEPMEGKKGYSRVGISRYIKTDYRRQGKPKYLVFAVN